MTEPFPPELKEVMLDLGQCIQAMGEYSDNVVLVGGLAPFLYRSILPEITSPGPAMTTFDIDWALPTSIPFRPDGLHNQLLAGGFTFLLSGSGDEPVTYYQHVRHPRDHLYPVHVEFITSRDGGMTTRSGQNQGIREVEKNLHAQTDPYIRLLLDSPLQCEASRIPELGLTSCKHIRVAHPMSFIVQKSLIRDRRTPSKQENDAAHIYDVAMLTHPIWGEMAAHLDRLASQGRFPPVWFRRSHEILHGLFASPESGGTVEVARKYRGMMGQAEAPTAGGISRAMVQFLEATCIRST